MASSFKNSSIWGSPGLWRGRRGPFAGGLVVAGFQFSFGLSHQGVGVAGGGGGGGGCGGIGARNFRCLRGRRGCFGGWCGFFFGFTFEGARGRGRRHRLPRFGRRLRACRG